MSILNLRILVITIPDIITLDITILDIIILFFFSILFSLAILHNLISKTTSPKLGRPPGPRGLPIIGNILDVGIFPHRMLPHQSMLKLKAKYGPVMWLQLGMTKTLVIQSAKAAEELYVKHDLAFSDRFVPDSSKAASPKTPSLAVAPYGEYWRFARKLCCRELLAHKKICAFAPTRQICVDIMMKQLKKDSDMSRLNGGSGEIELQRYIMLMTFNILNNFTMSRDVTGSRYEKETEFYEAVSGVMEWGGRPNVVDAFPFLKWIDPQRIRRNTNKYRRKLYNIISELVEERIQENKSGKEKEGGNDFLDALLYEEAAGELSKTNVIHLILTMFIGGTETTSTTINWAMAELLRNPLSLKKLKDEVDQYIGSTRMLEDDNIGELQYLQAVVKETMRLHPSLALIAREAREDTHYMGYFIPKKTFVLVSPWAIHRDPETWDNPLSFKPERFLDSSIDAKGKHFEFIPFGFGRRSCIGMFLAEKVVALTLAKLIQTFDWKLLINTSPDTLDMRERNGLSVRKRVPLMIIPSERKSKFST